MASPIIATAPRAQNGNPTHSVRRPRRNNGPDTMGPSVRARQPNEVAALLIVARHMEEGAVFVILEMKVSEFVVYVVVLNCRSNQKNVLQKSSISRE